MSKNLKIIPLGGLGEIGKNMTILEYGRNQITGDYPQVFSSKGKGCKKIKERVMEVVMTAAMPRKSQ